MAESLLSGDYLRRFGLALLALGAALLVQLVITVVYRLFFHPLAKYPGPFLAKVSGLDILWSQYNGDPHLYQTALHKRYGPVVRLAPDKLSFSTPTALKEIYTTHKVQKGQGYPATSAIPHLGNIFTVVNKNVHRVKRKAVNPAFSEHFIRSFESTIVENVNLFIDGLLGPEAAKDGWSPSRDMGEHCNWFTLDVMALFGFGTSFKLQTESTNRGAALGIKAAIRPSGVYHEAPWTRITNWHKSAQYKGGWTSPKWGEYVKEMIKTRISKRKDAHPDVFQFFAETKDAESGQEFKVDDLWSESRLFLIAGSDTSASVLASAFFYLTRYPEVCKKLEAEIRANFDSDADVQFGAKMNECRYLRAVIDESLRMNPPVGKAMWREVCEEGFVVDDQFIPPGMNVGVPLYSIFHDKDIYPEPHKFIPERWLESSGAYSELLPQAKAAFKPFSLGSRNCAGTNLAYAEMTTLLARTIWHTEFRIPDGPEARIGEGSANNIPGRRNPMEFQFEQYVVPMYEGPFIQFRRRKS